MHWIKKNKILASYNGQRNLLQPQVFVADEKSCKSTYPNIYISSAIQ